MESPSRSSNWPRRLLIRCLGAALLFLVFILHAWRYSDFLADDALISLQYTKRLLAGDGLTWTAGMPVEGYSNLLWVLVCAVPGMLGIDLIVGARILGFLATGLVILFLACRGDRKDRVPGLVAAAYFAIAGPVAVWAFGALEASLHAALLAAALFYGARVLSADVPAPADVWRASLFFGLLALNRPDGPIFVAGFAAVLLIMRRPFAASLRIAGRVLAGTAIAVVGQLVFRLSYYGEWLPNTAYVKIGGSMARLSQGLHYLGEGLSSMLELVVLSLFLSVLALRHRDYRAAALVTIVLAVGWSSYLALIGGDVFEGYRHLLPLLVILAFGLSTGLRALQEHTRNRRLNHLVLLVCGLSLFSFGWRQWTEPGITIASENRHVWFGKGLSETLRGAFSDRGPLFAVSAAGCFPYWTGFRCLDMLGLNDHHIARARPEGFGSGDLAHELGDVDYLLRKEPDLIFVGAPGRGAGRQLGGQYGQQLLDRDDFRDAYRLVRVKSEAPEPFASFIWMRITSPSIGMRHGANELTVPAYFFNGNPETVAELNSSHEFGIQVGPDRFAYLPLEGLPVPHVEDVEVHPLTTEVTVDLVEVEGGQLVLRLRSSESVWIERVVLSW